MENIARTQSSYLPKHCSRLGDYSVASVFTLVSDHRQAIFGSFGSLFHTRYVSIYCARTIGHQVHYYTSLYIY